MSGWEGPAPPRGCEVFVGKIPRDMYEDELVPLFERAGKIYEFRLMMEFSGENRGYAFVMYTNRYVTPARDFTSHHLRMLKDLRSGPEKLLRGPSRSWTTAKSDPESSSVSA